MKYERFGWYDLELWIRKHWKLCLILAAVVTAVIIVCTQPLTTDYHQMFTGYELHFDSEAEYAYHNAEKTQSTLIILDGKITRYLFKPDVFEGELFINGFEQVRHDRAAEYLERWPDTNTSVFIRSDGEVTEQIIDNLFLSGVFVRGEEERIMRVWARLDRGKEFFCFEIMRSGEMEYGEFDCIIAPAQFPERADKKFREFVLDDLLSFWESVRATAEDEPEE